MGVVEKVCKMDCVYWAPKVPGRDGQMTYATPVALKCRWEDTKQEFVSPDNTKQISSAVVMLLQDVELGGVLWLGLLQDVSNMNCPLENPGAWPIRGFDKIPKFKPTKFIRIAYLSQ